MLCIAGIYSITERAHVSINESLLIPGKVGHLIQLITVISVSCLLKPCRNCRIFKTKTMVFCLRREVLEFGSCLSPWLVSLDSLSSLRKVLELLQTSCARAENGKCEFRVSNNIRLLPYYGINVTSAPLQTSQVSTRSKKRWT